MPELPDVVVYKERLEALFGGRRLTGLRIKGPFLLRSVEPPLAEFFDKPLKSVGRLGKRLVFGFDGELYLVLHLMIAGRLRLKELGVSLASKPSLAAFDFEHASLLLTEQGTKKRASLYAVRGTMALSDVDRGGIEPLEASPAEFRDALLRENRTLKRALTDPRLLSGIGNAYSDEILHAAKLSPLQRTQSLDEASIQGLRDACRQTLTFWVERLRAECGDGFPERVTAFRDEMAVHGRFKKPCPTCGTAVQRIVYAQNEANYCPRCQTGGKLLSDRALSRLLKDDWPRSIEELEERRNARLGSSGRRRPLKRRRLS